MIQEKEKEKIERFLHRRNINNTIIQDDGKVDALGDVLIPENVPYNRLKKLPFKFGRVGGNFSVPHHEFKDFTNFPICVEGLLWCQNNFIINFEGFPRTVNRLDISYNPVYFILRILYYTDKGAELVRNLDKKDHLFDEHFRQLEQLQIKFIEYLNEFKAIRKKRAFDGIIVIDRLNQALFSTIGQELNSKQIDDLYKKNIEEHKKYDLYKKNGDYRRGNNGHYILQ